MTNQTRPGKMAAKLHFRRPCPCKHGIPRWIATRHNDMQYSFSCIEICNNCIFSDDLAENSKHSRPAVSQSLTRETFASFPIYGNWQDDVPGNPAFGNAHNIR